MQPNGSPAASEIQPPPGVVELREDVPLKSGTSLGADSGGRCCGGGPKFILACFAALSAGITLALFTQIYYGDYEVVPHGSVSSSAAACSRAGTDALKAGGGAVDAVAAAALCLAVLAPHRTSLDASGSMLYWQYRSLHSQPPTLFEWGGPPAATNITDRPPRLITALAYLHAQYGSLPWSRVLQPAIDLARNGYPVSEGLATATATALKDDTLVPGTLRIAAHLAAYLEGLQSNSSMELSATWGSGKLVTTTTPHETFAGNWKMFAGGAGAAVAGNALAAAMQPGLPDPDTTFLTVVSTLLQESLKKDWPPSGVSSGLAAVDKLDTYVALVTGLSVPFGSGPQTADEWRRDEPTVPLDLAPAIIVDDQTCGTRYIIGAESSAALAQGAAALLSSTIGAGAVERSRVTIYPGGVLGIEATREPPVALPPATLVNATLPYPAVNVVQQKVDALLSHADSRGGGLASRF